MSISYDNCTMDNWNKMQTVQHIHSHQQVEMVHNLSTSSSHNEEAEFRKSAAQIMQVWLHCCVNINDYACEKITDM